MGSAINVDGAEYNATTKSKMFKMSHPATEQTPAQTEYRYIGDNPNNYVYFNCDSLDNQNSQNCEVWRIIGVFDVDDGTGNYEQRIKLVRGSALPDKKEWDFDNSNDWTISSLNEYLNDNGDYYKRTGTASTYGLKENAKTLISNAKYYLGGKKYDESNGYGTADAMYLWERGTEVYSFETYCLYNSSNYACTENYCKNNSWNSICNITANPTNWVGKIALMYPSDFSLVYANGVDAACYSTPNNCKVSISDTTDSNGEPTKGWIYNSNNLENQNSISANWFLSPYSFDSGSVFYVSSLGNFQYEYDLYEYNGVRPVLYLSSNVKITDGTGEQNNPYKLGL